MERPKQTGRDTSSYLRGGDRTNSYRAKPIDASFPRTQEMKTTI